MVLLMRAPNRIGEEVNGASRRRPWRGIAAEEWVNIARILDGTHSNCENFQPWMVLPIGIMYIAIWYFVGSILFLAISKISLVSFWQVITYRVSVSGQHTSTHDNRIWDYVLLDMKETSLHGVIMTTRVLLDIIPPILQPWLGKGWASHCLPDSTGDCKNEDGEPGMCVAGAINNYTNQLLTKGNSFNQGQYNLTQALLFLSHFIGDIHQPLHVGFTSDKGGNTIDVHWYTIKTNLHHVWDNNIIETAEEDYYNSNVEDLVDALKHNITTGDWANQVSTWEQCSSNMTVCPDIYATESLSAACEWAYKDVSEDSVLEDLVYGIPNGSMHVFLGGLGALSLHLS